MNAAVKLELTSQEARDVALWAHGFADAKPATPAAIVNGLNVLQIDSVNVFSRSHYMPSFSRHGIYDTQKLDSELFDTSKFIEYWAHEAAFIPIADRALFGWRMNDFAKKYLQNGKFAAYKNDVARLKQQLADHGPSFVKDLELERKAKRGPWWDWSETKQVLEMLFATGEVVSLGRKNFVRQYALAEAIPEKYRQEISRDDAQDRLIEKAALALGVATAADLADYFRIKQNETNTAIRRLKDAGVLIATKVAGWNNTRGEASQAYVHAETLKRIENSGVRKLKPNSLLTPFDPLCWYRPRAERIFNFHYRIEIYTPKEKRKFGYYCLPILVAGKLAGRVDLKADRKSKTLLVQAAWQEENAPKNTAQVTEKSLQKAARWQGLEQIQNQKVGNLQLDL